MTHEAGRLPDGTALSRLGVKPVPVLPLRASIADATAIVRELSRAKVAFQARTLALIIRGEI